MCLYAGGAQEFALACPLPGAKYTFRVAASNAAAWGPPSAVTRCRAQAVPPGDAPAPAVLDVTVSSAKLQWQLPQDDGGDALTGMELQRYVVSDSGSPPPADVPLGTAPPRLFPTHTRHTKLAKLAPASHHACRVRGVNGAGVGPWSPWTVFCTDAVDVLPPLPPPHPPKAALSGTSVAVSWLAGVSRGAKITAYELRADDVVVPCGKSTKTTLSVPDQLPYGATCRLQVRAVAAGAGTSDWSTATTFSTPQATAGAGAGSGSGSGGGARGSRRRVKHAAASVDEPALSEKQLRKQLRAVARAKQPLGERFPWLLYLPWVIVTTLIAWFVYVSL